ncbi:MAG: hydroxyisourate hydrolase [Pseudonocardiaceae bacterium]
MGAACTSDILVRIAFTVEEVPYHVLLLLSPFAHSTYRGS